MHQRGLPMALSLAWVLKWASAPISCMLEAPWVLKNFAPINGSALAMAKSVNDNEKWQLRTFRNSIEVASQHKLVTPRRSPRGPAKWHVNGPRGLRRGVTSYGM